MGEETNDQSHKSHRVRKSGASSKKGKPDSKKKNKSEISDEKRQSNPKVQFCCVFNFILGFMESCLIVDDLGFEWFLLLV